MKKRKKKNQFRFLTKNFPKKMQKKLVMLFMTIILAFIVIMIRITYINVVKGEKYTRIVLNQQVYGSRVIPYKRGEIVDRNGTVLAVSERVYNVILDVFEMRRKEEYVEPTIMALKDIFGIEEQKIRDAIRETPDSRYTILDKGVSYEKAKQLEALLADEKKGKNVVGVWLEEDYKRVYPYNTLASDAIGFTYGGNHGQTGIEKYYDDVLNGTDGREYGYFNSASLSERTVKDAKNGYTVVSTIDMMLQSIVEQSIKDFNDKHHGEVRTNDLGSKNTAVMIMDPNTGEILAHASYPNFDLNKPDDLSYKFTKEQLKAMSPKAISEELNLLWQDFCISGDYEPGSTMKPFTVAAGLETGALKGNETYNCYGGLQVEDFYIKCHKLEGHGSNQTIKDAVANSCNVALMEMAKKIGAENLSRYQHIFGFGEFTGIDLPKEVDTRNLVYRANQMQAVELATNSFGQGINVSMVQLLSAYASLINGGNYFQPHIVKEIQDESGRVVEVKAPTLIKKTVSPETSETIKEYTREAVNRMPGSISNVKDYVISGKTGTAEKLPRGENNYVLSFIGHVPQENPEIVIYVVIDEPNVEIQDDSSLATELAYDILKQALPYLNVTKVQTEE